jgi:hypothetical protein
MQPAQRADQVACAASNSWLPAVEGNYRERMDDLDWLGFDGPVTDSERAFLRALRQRVAGGLGPWCRRQDELDDGSALIIGIHVDAPGQALLSAGVHLVGDRIRGDSLDHQHCGLPDRPTSLAIEVTGSPGDLAASAADWFDAILRRPIVRWEWLHAGQVYACRYLFADTGEGLSQMYNRLLAPPGQREQLIAAGHVQGLGWIDTRGLSEPGRVMPIRGGS